MTTRKYSSRSQQTTLTGSVTSGATSIAVASASTLLPGITLSGGQTYTVVIDPDTALEEILDVTSVSSNLLTVTRAVDGSSAQDHSAGAIIRHMVIGRDLREANTHIETSVGVHGIAASSSVVGTVDSQTLSNKTLGSALAAGGFKITGMADPTSAQDAATKNYVDTAGTSQAAAAATSAASAATSANSAATSATSAAASATAASGASASATAAATSATSAAASATAAATSATSAAASATAAATSATSAAASATTASNSAATASTAATNAGNSATAAATSATSAAASATSAATSATSAANSLTAITNQTGSGLVRDMGAITDPDTTTSTYINISTLTTQAQTSATSAATSASSAATSASSALTSQTAAATSATSAAASATAAATSANSAATSATSAAASATTAASFIPSQTGNSGKYLTTNGTTASWTSTTSISTDWGTVP